MKLAPTLKSWPRPPMPAMCHEKSLRNWYFFCCVACGVLTLWPMDTLFGTVCDGSRLFAVIALSKSAYWKMNSFSFAPPSTVLWFALIELNLLVLSPQPFGGTRGSTPYGWLFLLYP